MSTSVLSSTQTSVTPASSTAAQGSSSMGKDQFLKLLMAQLQNQDPTQPADPTAFTSQLAQFSALEMQQESNSTLTALATGQVSANQEAATSFVGKNVTYSTNNVTIASGGGALLTGQLGSDASNVTAVV
jgi:flagellar basal-body rod modification protein FlgD